MKYILPNVNKYHTGNVCLNNIYLLFIVSAHSEKHFIRENFWSGFDTHSKWTVFYKYIQSRRMPPLYPLSIKLRCLHEEKQKLLSWLIHVKTSRIFQYSSIAIGRVNLTKTESVRVQHMLKHALKKKIVNSFYYKTIRYPHTRFWSPVPT